MTTVKLLDFDWELNERAFNWLKDNIRGQIFILVDDGEYVHYEFSDDKLAMEFVLRFSGD